MKDIKFYSIGRGSLNIDGKFYYGLDYAITDFMIGLEKKTNDLEHNWNELKKWLEEEIYKIEPKGTAINYNCEYDSEEDYINAMKERSKLITLKRVLIMLQSLEEGGNNE